MLKLSSSRGIRIDVPVLSVSWSFEDHSVIIQAVKEGLIEHEASDTGGVPRWQSSCPDRLADATSGKKAVPFLGEGNSILDQYGEEVPWMLWMLEKIDFKSGTSSTFTWHTALN